MGWVWVPQNTLGSFLGPGLGPTHPYSWWCEPYILSKKILESHYECIFYKKKLIYFLKFFLRNIICICNHLLSSQHHWFFLAFTIFAFCNSKAKDTDAGKAPFLAVRTLDYPHYFHLSVDKKTCPLLFLKILLPWKYRKSSHNMIMYLLYWQL